MAFTLGIDLSAGVSAILDALSKIAPGIADVRATIDPDIRRRYDLMWLYANEAAFYAAQNGIADAVNAAGGQLQKIPQPGPLPTSLAANVTQPPLKMETLSEPEPMKSPIGRSIYTGPTASSSNPVVPIPFAPGTSGQLGLQGGIAGLGR